MQHSQRRFNAFVDALAFRRELSFEIGNGSETQLAGFFILALSLCNFQLILCILKLLFDALETIKPRPLWKP